MQLTVAVFLVWPAQLICDGLAVSPQSAGRAVMIDGTFTCIVLHTLAGLGEVQLQGLVFAPNALVCCSWVFIGGSTDTQRIAMRSKAQCTSTFQASALSCLLLPHKPNGGDTGSTCGRGHCRNTLQRRMGTGRKMCGLFVSAAQSIRGPVHELGGH